MARYTRRSAPEVAPPSFYPPGVQTAVARDAVESGGWSLCYQGAADVPSTDAQFDTCKGRGHYLMLAAFHDHEPSKLAVVAAGRAHHVRHPA